MRDKNLAMVDYGPVTIVKDLVQVDFDTVDEFELYAGKEAADAFRGKEYFYYCSDAEVIVDTLDPEYNWDNVGRVSIFEDMINSVASLIEKKDDVYFGKGEEDQLNIAKDLVFHSVHGFLRLTDAALMEDAPITAEQRESVLGLRDGVRDLANVARNATVNELDMLKGLVVPEVPEYLSWNKSI